MSKNTLVINPIKLQSSYSGNLRNLNGLIYIFQRNFCLLLEQHKRLFSKDAKFRTVISSAEEKTSYDTRTAYTGTVKGTYSDIL